MSFVRDRGMACRSIERWLVFDLGKDHYYMSTAVLDTATAAIVFSAKLPDLPEPKNYVRISTLDRVLYEEYFARERVLLQQYFSDPGPIVSLAARAFSAVEPTPRPAPPKLAPASNRVRVWFDRAEKALVARDLITGWSGKVHSASLRNAVFVVEPGERHGCVPTGYLGFVEGHEDFDPAYGGGGGGQEIRWDGRQFVAGGETIWAARSVRIEGGKMRATGCIPL